jgi:aspartate/methionine/tyrosine aminotransferase
LGATTFLQQLFLYLLDENSDCMMITPTFQDYYNQIRFARASITEVAMEEESPDWSLNIEKVRKSLKSNTRIIMLCSPNNPTGKVYSEKELTELGEIAKQNNILLVVDEAYNYLTYDKKFTSVLDIPHIGDCVVVARTFSKEFSMCGWRVGYAYLPESIYEELFHLQLSFNSVASAVSQKTAEISLQSQAVKEQVQKDIQATKEKRDFVTKCIDDIGQGLSYIMPQACPYLFVKYTKSIESYDLCRDIIDKVGVIVSPGVGNGRSGEYHFCITFADCMEVILEGMSRLKVYFTKYY